MPQSGSPPPRDPLERYASDLFDREEPLLGELRAEMERRGLPLIQVPVRTGLMLRILVAATGARNILEVGTLGGYSALWMAGALPEDGTILSLEKDPKRAELAQEFVEVAGVDDRVKVREGDARQILPQLGPDGSFDLVFLDADKEHYTLYLQHAERLLRPRGLLVADNAFWQGRVLEEPGDEATAGIQAFNQALAGNPSFLATVAPVGDGLAVAVRRGW